MRSVYSCVEDGYRHAAATYRAQYHFTVPDHWKNDPQRPVYVNGKFNYYYLTVSTPEAPVSGTAYPVAPMRIGTRSVAPVGGETPQPTVAGRLHVERDLEYWPDASAINSTLAWEKWFWRSLVPGQSFVDSVDLADADVAQPGRFRLRHWGLSSNLFVQLCTYPGFDHRLDLTFNDVIFPRKQWAGYWSADRAALTYDTTGVFLRQTGNQIRVAVPLYSVSGCSGFVNCTTRMPFLPSAR